MVKARVGELRAELRAASCAPGWRGCGGVYHEAEDALDGVVDVAEGARLLACSGRRKRRVGELRAENCARRIARGELRGVGAARTVAPHLKRVGRRDRFAAEGGGRLLAPALPRAAANALGRAPRARWFPRTLSKRSKIERGL